MKLSPLLLGTLLASAPLAFAADSPTPAPAASTAPATAVNASDLQAWQKDGPVTLDATKHQTEGQGPGAIRLDPGAKAVLPLSQVAGSGTVSFWIFDDNTQRKDEKEQHVGPRWGLISTDGHVLVCGIEYARFLSGNTGYVSSDSDQKNWYNVTWLSTNRATGWHQWTFAMDANTGLAISFDGKPLKRFDWNKTEFAAFSGIALFGDTPDDKNTPQSLWVDNIQSKVGGAMAAKPVPPPPPPPIVPDADPQVSGSVPEFIEAIRGKHPRLLVNADSLPKLRKFYQSPECATWRKMLEDYLPSCVPPNPPVFMQNDTDAQRQGFWRMPTVALHYLLTGDQTSRDHAIGYLHVLYDQPHWQTDGELDCGMGAANIMLGAALTYDWLYNDLDPAFREQFRQKLLHQARAMYYGGHLMKVPGSHYWQSTPVYNHRFHRDSGLVPAVMAAYEGDDRDKWLLQQTANEIAYVHKWLPADGSSHEGPTYQNFAASHLLIAAETADECLGTTYTQNSYYRNMAVFHASILLPGFNGGFGYGDWAGNGLGTYGNYMLKTTSDFHQPDVKDALMRAFAIYPDSLEFSWMSIVWDNPTMHGDATKLPLCAFFPDVGYAVVHESWADNAVAATFKCCPFGGHSLNRFAKETHADYINVAHDDPDANEFVIAIGHEFLAETDRYAEHKESSSHNTILINGEGQMSQGRAEGTAWSQPGGDMSQMGVTTAWNSTPKITAVEGEASGSYLKDKKRPALDRFRRTFLWVKGDYILVLDDIRAPEDVDVSWLVQGPKLTAEDEKENRYVLATGTSATVCPFQVVADKPLTCAIQPSTADGHGKILGFQQLQASAKASALKVASIYSPWQKKLTVTLQAVSPDETHVIVEGKDLHDVWVWKAGADRFTGSDITCKRDKGSATGFPFAMNPKNAAPPPDDGGPVFSASATETKPKKHHKKSED